MCGRVCSLPSCLAMDDYPAAATVLNGSRADLRRLEPVLVDIWELDCHARRVKTPCRPVWLWCREGEIF